MGMGANTVDPYAARRVQSALAPEVMAKIARLGMSPRQQALNRMWAVYRGQQYEARRVDWDGTERVQHLDAEAIATAGFIPPGYYDAGAQFPLKFRRPTATYHLRRVIVDRFTGLLFSDRKHPFVRIEGDPATEDYVRTLAEVSRLWPSMIQARTYGGAMGTSVIGFQFVDGRPVVEVDDPRWCYPTFEDRHQLKLAALEKRYMYPVDERDPESGLWVQRAYWYRRVIDAEKDVLFKPVPVGDGEEPEWEIEREVVHGFGFCPRVWVQNSPVQDDIDGDPDCVSIDDMCEQIDALLSQANAGILANCVGVETPFITASGVRTFGDFREGAETVVLTHTGAWKPAKVRAYGEQQLYRVRVGRGQNAQVVRATAQHRWLLADGRTVVTADLRAGDKLHKPPHLIRDWEFVESSPEAQRYWAWGFAYGDGGISRQGDKVYGTRLRLCGKKDRFLSRFEALGYEAQFPAWAHGDPMVYLRDYAKTLPTLEAVGHENMMAFVRGFLDADGSRNRKHPETADVNPFQGIQATGEETIRFIREVFPAVGAYIVAEDDRSEGETNFGPRTGPTVYFSLVLGFSNSPVAPYIVRDVEADAVEQVWCLEVQDDQSFVLPSGVVTRNCDPTLRIISDADLDGIRKGSRNALKLPQGSSADYMEMTGSGPKAALEMAERLRALALEVAQCVLDTPQHKAHQTATEIERSYASMLAKADVLREQYGERGVKPLLEMMVKAVRVVTKPRPVGGVIVRQTVELPPKLHALEDGTMQRAARELGPGGAINLSWGPYFDPSLTDLQTAVRAAVEAKAGGIIDTETATKFVAPYFLVEDATSMAKKVIEEQAAAQAALDQSMAGMMGLPPDDEGSVEADTFSTTEEPADELAEE